MVRSGSGAQAQASYVAGFPYPSRLLVSYRPLAQFFFRGPRALSSRFTNEVYGYEVVDLHAWEKAEGETNAFAAPGRSGAMVIPQDVLELRSARVKTKSRRDK